MFHNLRKMGDDLLQLLDLIDLQIEIIEAEADRMGIPPLEMRTPRGDWVMKDVLVAKAQVLSSVVTLGTL